MTFTDGTPPTAPLPQLGAAWDRCDHCRAPLDERQRYCVGCGARRPASEDPVARWFAADRRARISAASAPAADAQRGGRGGSGVTTALLIALLPLAAAAGVFVGRGANGDSDSELLVAALRAQKPPVVNIVGGSGGGAAATSDDGGGGSSSADASAKNSRDKAARSARDGGRVIAHTRYGDARQLTGARISRETRDESRRALEKIANSKGRAYVESQRGLPDQIVIP